MDGRRTHLGPRFEFPDRRSLVARGFAHDRGASRGSRPTPRRQGLSVHPFNDLALFSGGLDSLIGAIDTLEAGRTPLLISHAGEGRDKQRPDHDASMR